MRKIFTLITLVVVIASCNRVPITERRQVAFIPQGQLAAMANDSYRDFLRQNQVVTGTTEAQWVQNSGRRIAQAVEQYLRDNNMANRIPDFQWEFNLVQDKQINAWAMPGGKVVFYTGIMPLTNGELGTSVVMGHEVAHAVARHGNERMSQMLLVQLGGVALDVALSEQPDQTRQLFFAAYGAGAQLGVILPYSRLHESEADKLGMIFMAMAGYHPQEAAEFWTRMQQKYAGQEPPEFLSTHPSSQRRITDLRNYQSEAMKYYKPQ
jgi:predicted Zn-dependent protease